MLAAGARSCSSRVRTTSAPTVVPPIRPVVLSPARMGTSCPSTRPMRRVKNGTRPSPRPRPNWKMSAPWRKNVRFSGKNRGKRVRLVWRVSTSVSAKSVLMLRAAVRFGPRRFVTSRLGSKIPRVEASGATFSKPPTSDGRTPSPSPRSNAGSPSRDRRGWSGRPRSRAPGSPSGSSPAGAECAAARSSTTRPRPCGSSGSPRAPGSRRTIRPRHGSCGPPIRRPSCVHVFAPRLDQRVEARAPRVHREDIARAAVVERIQHQHQVVLFVEVAVALLGEAHDPGGSGSSQRTPKTSSRGPASTFTPVRRPRARPRGARP